MMFHTELNKEPTPPPPEPPEWKYRVMAWVSLLLGLAPRQTMIVWGLHREAYRFLFRWGWGIRLHVKPNRPLLRITFQRWETPFGRPSIWIIFATRLLSRPYTPREAKGLAGMYERLFAEEDAA